MISPAKMKELFFLMSHLGFGDATSVRPCSTSGSPRRAELRVASQLPTKLNESRGLEHAPQPCGSIHCSWRLYQAPGQASWAARMNHGADYNCHRMKVLRSGTRPRLIANRLVYAAMLQPKALLADTVPVRHTEGLMHGFLVLRTLEGKVLADGQLTQDARGDRVTNRLERLSADSPTQLVSDNDDYRAGSELED
jgi:hypothetical protein